MGCSGGNSGAVDDETAVSITSTGVLTINTILDIIETRRSDADE